MRSHRPEFKCASLDTLIMRVASPRIKMPTCKSCLVTKIFRLNIITVITFQMLYLSLEDIQNTVGIYSLVAESTNRIDAWFVEWIVLDPTIALMIEIALRSSNPKTLDFLNRWYPKHPG